MASDLSKYAQNNNPMAQNTNPMAGVKKPAVSQTATSIKKPVMAPVMPAGQAAPMPEAPAGIPGVATASPYSTQLVPQGTAQPPSMSNVPANPQATGQATPQEVNGLTLEQWRNVQRMLGMAPSV